MSKEESFVTFLAVLVIIISTVLSGFGTLYFLDQKSLQNLAGINSSIMNINNY